MQVGSIVLHAGVNDIRHRQSEILKADFAPLIRDTKERTPSAKIFVSGPLPLVRRSNEYYSRLLGLNNWLQGFCKKKDVGFINNWNLFLERPRLFKRDGLHPNSFGARVLSENISKDYDAFFESKENNTVDSFLRLNAHLPVKGLCLVMRKFFHLIYTQVIPDLNYRQELIRMNEVDCTENLRKSEPPRISNTAQGRVALPYYADFIGIVNVCVERKLKYGIAEASLIRGLRVQALKYDVGKVRSLFAPLYRRPGIAAGGVMDVNTALQEVLKTALIHDGLARGIREAAKALDKRQAHLCVLASNCDEPMYVKLVEALCAEHQINLIKLGEWVGLCKIDREGKPRKVVGCSCVVIKDYGKESQAKDVIEEYFKSKK
ncbi:RS12 protein, partial [Polypterus senegalus]